MRLFLLSGIITFLLTSCKDCPPNVYLGRVALSDETKSEIIYTDVQLAIFKNADGDLLPLKISGFNRIALSEGVIIGETCSSPGGNSLVKGDLEYVFGELTWPDSAFQLDRAVDLGIIYGMQPLDYIPDTSFADVVNVYSILRNQNTPDQVPPYGYLIKVTSDRGHADDRIDRLNKNAFLQDTVMLNRQFDNVYRPAGNGLIYYVPGRGVVAFRDGLGELWVLERIE